MRLIVPGVLLGIVMIGVGLGGYCLLHPKPMPPPLVFEDKRNGVICYVHKGVGYASDTISCVPMAEAKP